MLLFDELASPIAARRHGWLAGPRDVVARADPAVLESRIPPETGRVAAGSVVREHKAYLLDLWAAKLGDSSSW